MKSAGKARSNGLYRHIRTSKEIIRNLLNDSFNILPLGSLVLALFCCNSFGWGWDAFVQEANTGKGLKVQPWMKPIFRFVVPAAIAFIYIYGMATFAWN